MALMLALQTPERAHCVHLGVKIGWELWWLGSYAVRIIILPSLLLLPQVVPGDTEDEAIAVFQYAVYDKRTPLLDDAGNKARKVQVEQARFLRAGDDGGWQFVDVKLVEVPEALAKVAEQQARDMAAAAGQPGKQQPSP